MVTFRAVVLSVTLLVIASASRAQDSTPTTPPLATMLPGTVVSWPEASHAPKPIAPIAIAAGTPIISSDCATCQPTIAKSGRVRGYLRSLFGLDNPCSTVSCAAPTCSTCTPKLIPSLPTITRKHLPAPTNCTTCGPTTTMQAPQVHLPVVRSIQRPIIQPRVHSGICWEKAKSWFCWKPDTSPTIPALIPTCYHSPALEYFAYACREPNVGANCQSCTSGTSCATGNCEPHNCAGGACRVAIATSAIPVGPVATAKNFPTIMAGYHFAQPNIAAYPAGVAKRPALPSGIKEKSDVVPASATIPVKATKNSAPVPFAQTITRPFTNP